MTGPQAPRAAFTLIELCVVMLILGLAASVVFPRVCGGALEGARLRRSAARIASLAVYARARAASLHQMHTLYVEMQTGRYWVSAGVPSQADAGAASVDPARRGSLHEGARFSGVRVGGETHSPRGTVSIRFGPEGWADPASMRLVGRTGRTAAVRIGGLCGRVEVYVPAEDMPAEGGPGFAMGR